MGMFGIFKKKGEDDDKDDEGGPFQLNASMLGDDSQLVDLGLIEDFSTAVAPNSLLNKDHYIQVGNEYIRSIYAYQYPPDLEIGWLNPLTTLSDSIDFSLHIQPVPVTQFLDILNDRVSKDGAVITRILTDGDPMDYDLQQRYEDNKGLAEMIQRRETKPFQLALIVTARAPSLKELNQLTEKLERQIMKPSTTRTPDLRHHDGFVSTLPACQNNIADNFSLRILHTIGMLAFFPFTASELTHETGVLMGINQYTFSNVIVNRFDSSAVRNANMAIFGASGSGKSYFAKMEALQWSLLGYPIVVIDPQREYVRLAQSLGGQVIEMGLSSRFRINPLDFSQQIDPRSKVDPDIAEKQGNVLAVKIDSVITLLAVMLQSGRGGGMSLSNRQEVLLERSLRRLYKDFGYDTMSIKSQTQATRQVMPTLSDLYALLTRLSKRNPDDRAFQEDMQNLLLGLSPYIGEGAYAGLFDTKTNVELNSDFIVFNILDVSKRMMPPVMQMILEFLTSTLFSYQQAQSGVRRLLYIDESHRLMAFPETAQFMERSAREARKFGVGFTIINQDTDKFLLSEDGVSPNPAGRAILNGCASRMLMQQEANIVDVIKEVFKLNDEEALALINSGKGEGLLYVGRDRAWISAFGLMSQTAHELLKSEVGDGRVE
jgi:hypothetical protein